MILDEIFEFIFEIIFVLIVGIICFNTGEIIVYILTFGRKKPQWNYIKNIQNNKFSKRALLTETTVLVGFIFWIIVIILFGH